MDNRLALAPRLLFWLIAWAAVFSAGLTWADSDVPRLRLETGMHWREIISLGTNDAQRYLVTASKDLTIRVWDLESGALLRTLRPPREYLAEDRTPLRVQLSANGKVITVETGGSWTYQVEWNSGRIIHEDLNLSWRVSERNKESHGGFLGPDESAARLDSDRTGRVVQGKNGYIALYNAKLKRIAQVRPAAGLSPGGLCFSPDGKKVAVGYVNSPRVDVLSGKDLKLLYQPDLSGVQDGDLRHVAFSVDGKSLYAGATWAVAGLRWIRRWKDGGRGSYKDLPAAHQDITSLVALPRGGLAFGTADPAWSVFSDLDERVIFQGKSVVDFHGLRLLVDDTGNRVQFAYDGQDSQVAQFSVSDRALTLGPPADPDLKEPRTTAPKLAILEWQNSREFGVNGTINRFKDDTVRSLAIAPDEKSFVLGTDKSLFHVDALQVAANIKRGEDLSTVMVPWGTEPPRGVLAVNVSGDGKLLVAGLRHGTIRWYSMSDHKLLLVFFPHPDRKRWVLYTPSGYYDASPGAEDLIGWEVAHGPAQVADFFSAARFRKRYYRPDIIDRVLRVGDEWLAVAAANDAAQQAPPSTALPQVLPPVVTIQSPADGAVVSGAQVVVRVAVHTHFREPVTALRVLVDGRMVTAEIQPVPGTEAGVSDLIVPLPQGSSTVAVLAESATGVGDAVLLHVRRPAPQGAFTLKPKLYVLAVGVGAYPSQNLRLLFPAKDAGDLAAALRAQAGKLYREVQVKVLADKDATKTAILDGLQWLQQQTTDKDVAVLFLAGHGVEDPSSGQYYYIPYDGELGRMMSTLLPDVVVRQALSGLAGKVLLFLDTCHAGKVFADRNLRGTGAWIRFVNELSSAENGVVVFASSTGRQSSQEAPEWGNGAFTKALVEGLAGKADYRHSGRITVDMLDYYISERVKALTGGTQSPTTAKPSTVPDFPIAVVP